LLRRVVWQFTNVSEVLAASIIRAMSTSETSVNFYQATRRNNRRENLKSHLFNIVINAGCSTGESELARPV
jgi:hypothetical protein